MYGHKNKTSSANSAANTSIVHKSNDNQMSKVRQLPIQAKFFTHTLVSKLNGQTGRVWGGRGDTETWGDGPVYKLKNDIGTKNSKVDALSSAASKAAEIGKEAQNQLSGIQWASNKAAENLDVRLSPFLLNIDASWSDNINDKVSLRYHFGGFNNGYVVGAAIGESNLAAMADRKPVSTADIGLVTTYSNRHENADDNTPIIDQIAPQDEQQSQHNNEMKLDALTKIGGEGARWQAVRKAAGKLSNSLVFYAPDDKVSPFKGIKFKDLWSTWSSEFDKGFNISDDTFAKKLKTGGTTWNKTVTTEGTQAETITLESIGQIKTTAENGYQTVYEQGKESSLSVQIENKKEEAKKLATELNIIYDETPEYYDLYSELDKRQQDVKELDSKKKALKNAPKNENKSKLKDLKKTIEKMKIELSEEEKDVFGSDKTLVEKIAFAEQIIEKDKLKQSQEQQIQPQPQEQQIQQQPEETQIKENQPQKE